jgi:signal transduction histidine kinase
VELHSSSDNRYYSEVTNVPVSGLTVKIPKIDWTIVVEWPLNEADTIVTNFRNTILLTVFVSIIIVIILALILAKHLINPVKKLQNASQEIEKGNFENKVIITTNDELEELGDSFNTMANGLKRLEELKNEFVYVAAHELRAPVTAVKGYMELIFDGAGGTVSPELEKLLTPVKKSNERLVNLVNDLLKVARQEAGRLEIILSRTNIVNHIVSILEEVTPLAKKRNIELRYVKKEIPDIMINDGSFKEVIMNFVSNAIKYGNDNGFVEITHSVENNILYTTIKDNGRGMSPEDQKHLFEKFFRASDVKNSSIEGTGLGLFITKELVEKMNGTLSVQSVPGQGTTFTIGFKIVS